MDLRILYAFSSAFLAGSASFLQKISAEKDHNPFLFTTYSFFSLGFFSFIGYLFSGVYVDKVLFLTLISIIMGSAYLIVTISRMRALKNITSTLYFPIYKISSTIVAFIVGIYFFQDLLKWNEIIGIILGLLVPIILINKKEKLKQKNIVKGVFLCLISAFFAVITIIISKIVNTNDLNIYFYIFIGGLTGGLLSLFQYKRKIKLTKKSVSKIKRIAIFNGFLVFVGSVFFVKAMKGSLGVVYTINSFSILVPIVLSIIFYKEALDLRKIIAIILTIVSMLFFKVF